MIVVGAIWCLIRINSPDIFPGLDRDVENHCVVNINEPFLFIRLMFAICLGVGLMFKLLYYLRVYKHFSILVELILEVKNKVIPFLLILVLVTMFFATFYSVILEGFDDDIGSKYVYSGANLFL